MDESGLAAFGEEKAKVDMASLGEGDVPPRLERLLAGVELSLSVAREPRRARVELLGAAIAERSWRS